ncbi:MAG: endonuclease/exonuclease/phosphatase family protein [Pseudomonadota bacterium]
MFHGNLDVDTAKGLQELRKRIQAANIPPSTLDASINIATWNIREFGKKRRLNASIHFIAEILNQFDLIAITEVRNNLKDLGRVLDVLGDYWKIVYSDHIADSGGNWERVAYLYDKRSVVFTGFAAEADAPRKKDKTTGEYVPLHSWWRKPYIASFKSGSFDFMLITAHIRWDKEKNRIRPLKLLAEWIEKRRKDPFAVDKDIILMGDFNIPAIDDDLFKAITSQGLRIPAALRGTEHGSNLAMNKRYDQILHYPTESSVFTDHGGILDFYSGGVEGLYPNNTPNETDFTYQLSDHLPLWIQLIPGANLGRRGERFVAAMNFLCPNSTGPFTGE